MYQSHTPYAAAGGQEFTVVVDASSALHLGYRTFRNELKHKSFATGVWSESQVLANDGFDLQFVRRAETDEIYAIWQSMAGIEYRRRDSEWQLETSTPYASDSAGNVSCLARASPQGILCLFMDLMASGLSKRVLTELITFY